MSHDRSPEHQPGHAKPASGAASADFPIVGIGASAGGLEACKALIGALPPVTGMAFLLVQHLDPNHESLLVDLLAGGALLVEEASDGVRIVKEHLYVIPPGAFLSIEGGVLRLSPPPHAYGARLPIDFLLASLARVGGRRAVCVILSGTGQDGSLGARAIKKAGGRVFVQDPNEARSDGMPRSAIATGAADLVLPVARIPKALLEDAPDAEGGARREASDAPKPGLDAIVDLLRTGTRHDFTSYKLGTLQRRVERRMAMARIDARDTGRYLEILRKDSKELEILAKDLLIHVTGFFRDRDVFALLKTDTIPELLRACSPARSVRVWIAGCSTGEETYSIAMLFREVMRDAKTDIALQIFASDVDADAVEKARAGRYPTSIEADVSAERLSAFFSKDDDGYKVSPELRSAVVFTVQDVLVDPPFARLDMVSCRNLMIYLAPPAQAKLVSLFRFALKQGGILLLGSSETVGAKGEGRFETISKTARLYRAVGCNRPLDATLLAPASIARGAKRDQKDGTGPDLSPADVCRRAVMRAYAPASVLIDARNACLYHHGGTRDYLSVATGPASHDVLEMAADGMRAKLRAAILRARREKARVAVPGGSTNREGVQTPFQIDVRAADDAGELLLVSFVDKPESRPPARSKVREDDASRVAELEGELASVRAELSGAISELETSGEDQKVVNEEALSFNEEYQSTNEELVTSKEELQAFNEELAALNGQLQETLEKQRTTSNDLQNVLYSTDVATLFLDADLRIRFFTPATKAVFNVIASDVGRPLDDLKSLASDDRLASDIQKVLHDLAPLEREVEGRGGVWFVRRILPYKGHDGSVAGVVMTFTDVTGRKHDSSALEAAKRQAEQATLVKSRFLAAASHDLRQPLQTLSLIQGLLAKTAKGEGTERLVVALAETLSAMGGMLDTLLDVNQIEAGTVRLDVVSFPIIELLDRLRDEFAYHVEAHNLSLHVVASSHRVLSDRSLLERMVRNLLSNALKYTSRGKVLLGCRRRGGVLRIEIWDTGSGIADRDLAAIFGEYHQLGNAARERSRGLGLGLSIVQRLGKLLGHRVDVRSVVGKGSVFTVDVALADEAAATSEPRGDIALPHRRRTGLILIVEDDPQIRELLSLTLSGEGHRTVSAQDGSEALRMVAKDGVRPDLILADYNLPNEMDGLESAKRIQKELGRKIPVVILTGDISTTTLRTIAEHDCVKLDKPVLPDELSKLLQELLAPPSIPTPSVVKDLRLRREMRPVVFVIDDDDDVREWIRGLFESDGRVVEDFPDAESFLRSYRPGSEGCLLVDACLPGKSGLELLAHLRGIGETMPAIVITGRSDVAMAIGAMKVGASDFIEKPGSPDELLACVERALAHSHDVSERTAWREDAVGHLARLTPRQHQIMDLVLAGNPSKNIAVDLGISQRTVENHRASIMRKTGSKSLPALARLVLTAVPA